jgi:hypothetical protein
VHIEGCLWAGEKAKAVDLAVCFCEFLTPRDAGSIDPLASKSFGRFRRKPDVGVLVAGFVFHHSSLQPIVFHIMYDYI